MCRRKTERRYDLGNKRRPPGIRTRVCTRPTTLYIIKSWHILPTARVLFFHCTYWATRKFRTCIRTHVRTRVRRELLRRRGFDQADSKGCNPLPPVATDVRHVWSFRKIKRRLEQLGNFRVFFNLSLPLILFFFYSASPVLSSCCSPFALRLRQGWLYLPIYSRTCAECNITFMSTIWRRPAVLWVKRTRSTIQYNLMWFLHSLRLLSSQHAIQNQSTA